SLIDQIRHREIEVQSDQIKTRVPDEYADKDLPSQPPIGRLDLLIGPERQVLGCFQETQHRTPSPAHEFIDYWRVGCAARLLSAGSAGWLRPALEAPLHEPLSGSEARSVHQPALPESS